MYASVKLLGMKHEYVECQAPGWGRFTYEISWFVIPGSQETYRILFLKYPVDLSMCGSLFSPWSAFNTSQPTLSIDNNIVLRHESFS
jgi:hypothetical protein